MHPSIWKLIPLLMKEEMLARMKKCTAKRGDESTNQKKEKGINTMNDRLGRQILRYKPQNKISYLHSIAMNLHTF